MEPEAAAERVTGQRSSRTESYPRDLLRRLSGISSLDDQPEPARGDSDEIELSLGLSLGGSFGFDPNEKRIVRSSSIASLSVLPRDQDFPAVAPLARTCSLPTETEEEQRRRKEIQSLKRLEAKRKRSEKRNSKPMAAAARDRAEDRTDEVELGGGYSGFPGGGQFGRPVDGVAPPRLPSWVANRTVDVSGCFPQAHGSVGSQGSSSSGVSDFESRPMQGFEPMSELTGRKSTSTSPTGLAGRDGGGEVEPSRKEATVEVERRNMMEEMPCVSTRGEGPNGRRIEGFLYKYKKGEEVRIVCVCHGRFLTPAEFVKHAGGGDVEHPLRHIVVSPSSPSFA